MEDGTTLDNYSLEDLQNMTDDQLKELEEQLGDGTESINDGFASPKSHDSDSVLKFFREIWRGSNSVKVSNLQKEDLGQVRAWLHVANACDSFGFDKVGCYLKGKAEVEASTSMGLKGFFAQLIVTQIKKELKNTARPRVKKGLFDFRRTAGLSNDME